jgi:hypothetical protein
MGATGRTLVTLDDAQASLARLARLAGVAGLARLLHRIELNAERLPQIVWIASATTNARGHAVTA